MSTALRNVSSKDTSNPLNSSGCSPYLMLDFFCDIYTWIFLAPRKGVSNPRKEGKLAFIVFGRWIQLLDVKKTWISICYFKLNATIQVVASALLLTMHVYIYIYDHLLDNLSRTLKKKKENFMSNINLRFSHIISKPCIRTSFHWCWCLLTGRD